MVIVMSKIKLTEVASYSNTRISCADLSEKSYVGTDNLLQSKQGKVNSDFVPNTGYTTEYKMGDTLIANIRPYLRKIWYAINNGGSSPDVLAIRPSDKINSKFLYYALFQEDFFNYAMKGSKGTKMPRGDKKQIMDFLIPHISKCKQQSIAETLSVLDDKIELNNRINDQLEKMARTLYDYWFVQFDFPDENKRPYKSAGGKMVFNPTLGREIPAGWEVKELSQIIKKIGTGLNPRDNFKLGSGDNFYVTIKNMEHGKVILDNRCDKINDEAIKIIDNRSDLRAGDILFTSIEPVGTTYLIYEKPSNWNINESIFTIRPNNDITSPEFLYMLLSGKELKAFTKNSVTGSIHKGIRHGVLKTFRFPFSNKKIIENFSNIIRPLIKEIYINNEENRNLVDLRDFLLPMLMNGQISP